MDVAIFAPGYDLGKPHLGRDGRRMTFTGSADEIAADARAFKAAGVRHINIGFESNDLAEAMDKIEGLARDVMPKVG